MLVLILGVWLNVAAIEKMTDRQGGCWVSMTGSYHHYRYATCAVVAHEIEKAMKK